MQGKFQTCLYLCYGHFKFEQNEFKKNLIIIIILIIVTVKKSVHPWYGSSPDIRVREGNLKKNT